MNIFFYQFLAVAYITSFVFYKAFWKISFAGKFSPLLFLAFEKNDN